MNVAHRLLRRIAFAVAVIAAVAVVSDGTSTADPVGVEISPAIQGPVALSLPQPENSCFGAAGMPGRPVQYSPDVVSIHAAYGVSQRITDIGVLDGQSPVASLPPGWNRPLPLTPGAANVIGPWSSNTLRPNPTTGDSSFAFYGNAAGELNATVKRKYRVKAVAAVPVHFSTIRIAEQNLLVITYKLTYAAQRFTHGDVNGIQFFDIPKDDDRWTALSDSEVAQLHRIGVTIPTP